MSSRNGSTVAFLASFTLFFSFSVGATRCRAQSETDGSQANAPSFKSIAIKTDNSGIRSHAINLGPGQLTVTNVTLGVLIQNAYKLEDNQISAAPPWLNTQPYDIVASLDRPPSEEAPTNELRALLSDCFKLAVHRETRLVPVYALRVAEGGAKFVEPVTTDASDLRVIHVERGRIAGREVPVSTLAKILSEELDHPVLDETGLRGHYEVTLEWQADSNSPVEAVSEALEDQLGLKLELEQVPKEFLIIDHVESPSEN